TVPRAHAETLESVELSPFTSAPNPDYDQEDQEEDLYYEPPVVQEGTDNVLAAQFQHVLDLEDREPENPLLPEEPAYLQLVEQAVEFGLNVPPPPPIAVVLHPPQPAQVAPPVQPIMAGQGQTAPVGQPAPVVAAAPAMATDKLRGVIPEIFNGDRRKSDRFLRQFNMLMGLNENHEIMITPYYLAMYELSLMRGPNIDDWVDDQVRILRDRHARAQNPVGKDEAVHWDEFNRAFVSAYTATAKKQTAQQKLLALKMFAWDLDSYISTFNHLC